MAALPLAPATRTKLQTTLTAPIPVTTGEHALRVFVTGDPRVGLWALGKIELLR